MSDLKDDEYYCGHKKIRIYPTEEQKKIIDPNFDIYRAAYNYVMGVYSDACYLYDMGAAPDKPSRFDMQHNLKEYKHQEGKEWLLKGDAGMLKNASDHAVQAYDQHGKHFIKRKDAKKKTQFYQARKERTHIYNNELRIPGLKRGDTIQMSYDTGINSKQEIIDPVIYKDKDGNYYISFITKEKKKHIDSPKTAPLGIDVGIINLYTTSNKINGTHYHHRDSEKEIQRLDRSIAKVRSAIARDENRRKDYSVRTKTKFEDAPKSKRELKRERLFDKFNKRKANLIRQNCFDMANAIVKTNPEYICVEHFPKQKLYKDNSWVDKRMNNVHTYDMRMAIENKANQYGVPCYKADANFPSSQRCSNCGEDHKVGKSRMYQCPHCGYTEDRDLNGSYNLSDYPRKQLGVKVTMAVLV